MEDIVGFTRADRGGPYISIGGTAPVGVEVDAVVTNGASTGNT